MDKLGLSDEEKAVRDIVASAGYPTFEETVRHLVRDLMRRENLRHARKHEIGPIVERALNETASAAGIVEREAPAGIALGRPIAPEDETVHAIVAAAGGRQNVTAGFEDTVRRLVYDLSIGIACKSHARDPERDHETKVLIEAYHIALRACDADAADGIARVIGQITVLGQGIQPA